MTRKIFAGRGKATSLLCLLYVLCGLFFVTTTLYSRNIHLEEIKSLSKMENPVKLVERKLANDAKSPTVSKTDLRRRYPPSIWTLAGRNSDPSVAAKVKSQLSDQEKTKALDLCGKFLFSSLRRAVQVGEMGEYTFVATGDIDDMWTRDSAVQMGIYFGRLRNQPWLRRIVEGFIRRSAFNIIQDPYANAYERTWRDPNSLAIKDRVIGRGGWVATRNYELDSNAYFLNLLWDYYVADGIYRPEAILDDPIIFDAVLALVDVMIVEQSHEKQSSYRYFELERQGMGKITGYTGMTWTGFRPSDDKCMYNYLIPANIHTAAGLQRLLVLNQYIWKSEELRQKASKLLFDIEDGIARFGVVTTKDGESVYAYEVDGFGNALVDFDDANVPSLLSIPLLGWSNYNRTVYETTRRRLLDPTRNRYYYKGKELQGQGSPHTPMGYVWPMSFAIEGLTSKGSPTEVADALAFQVRQSLRATCNDSSHEGVHSDKACETRQTRQWFEWANALFVVLVESALGDRCDASARDQIGQTMIKGSRIAVGNPQFYENQFRNDHTDSRFYLGIEAQIPHSA